MKNEYYNMLNCFKGCKIYHILNRFLELALLKYMKLALEQKYMLYVLHSQYHACWCSGDFRSQGISRYGIDPQSRNNPSPVSEQSRNRRLQIILQYWRNTKDVNTYVPQGYQ